MTATCTDEAAGQLMALGAIASTSRTPGGPTLAALCFEHARQHPTPKPESEDAK